MMHLDDMNAEQYSSCRVTLATACVQKCPKTLLEWASPSRSDFSLEFNTS